jgi:hypothetical protein
MNPVSRYRLVTNLCLVTVIGSALLFDRVGAGAGGIVGGVGIVAGLVAVFAYLRLDGRGVPSSGASDSDAPVARQEVTTSGPLASQRIGGMTQVTTSLATDLQVADLQISESLLVETYTFVVKPRRNDFADTVVEIVERLCATGSQSYEFTFSPSGEFCIRTGDNSKRLDGPSKSPSDAITFVETGSKTSWIH